MGRLKVEIRNRDFDLAKEIIMTDGNRDLRKIVDSRHDEIGNPDFIRYTIRQMKEEFMACSDGYYGYATAMEAQIRQQQQMSRQQQLMAQQQMASPMYAYNTLGSTTSFGTTSTTDNVTLAYNDSSSLQWNGADVVTTDTISTILDGWKDKTETVKKKFIKFFRVNEEVRVEEGSKLSQIDQLRVKVKRWLEGGKHSLVPAC